MEIHNVYIAAHPPVDDWEILRKPMQLQERHPIKMHLYYLSEQEKEEGLQRLQDVAGAELIDDSANYSEADLSEHAAYYRKQLADKADQKQREAEKLFAKGKPIFTYMLLAVNLLLFLLLVMNGGSTSTETLIRFGAKYNPAILEMGNGGESLPPCFCTLAFLIGHEYACSLLLGNSCGAYLRIVQIHSDLFFGWNRRGTGKLCVYGEYIRRCFWCIVWVIRCPLVFGVMHKRVFFQTMGMNLLILVGINIGFGLLVPQIDNSAHLGGLIAGFIASVIVRMPGRKSAMIQVSAFLLYVLLTAGLVAYGVTANEENPAYQLMNAEQLLTQNKYEEVVDVATTGLTMDGKLSPDLESRLLFQRSYAYIQLGRIDQAIADLEKSTELNDQFAEAYYNLAILYDDQGTDALATEHIQTAYELDSGNKDIQQLYERITGKPAQ